MKGNSNIEELFKQKFDSFQPDVDPSVWANIQAGIGAGTAATAAGISTALKIGLISGGIIAASVATWYFGFNDDAPQTEPETTISAVLADENKVQLPPPAHTNEPIIVVNDQNDPVIQENRQVIEQELRNHQSANTVNADGGTSQNNGGSTSITPANTVTDNTNSGGTTTQSGTTDNGSGSTPPDKVEPVPSGRMDIVQVSNYAPSNVSFGSSALNYKEVRWDFGDGSTAEGTQVKHVYTKPGKFTVKMTVVGAGKTNYEETREVLVKSKSSIDNVPNVITPNGDRINDYFAVKSTDIETFYIVITDNRGNEIFSSNDKDFSWDGTDFSGQPVEKGMYTYVIIAEGKDGSVIKLPGQIYVQ